MSKKAIISVLTLIALITGITIFGYGYQLRYASVSTQMEMPVAKIDAGSVSDIESTDIEGADIKNIDNEDVSLPDDTGRLGTESSNDLSNIPDDYTEKSLPVDTDWESNPDKDPDTASDTAVSADSDILSNDNTTDIATEQLKSANAEEIPTADMAKVSFFPEPKTMYVQQPVNVRKGPDTSFDIIGFLSLNEKLSILGQYENEGWYYFLYHDEVAFASNHYINESMVEISDEPSPAASAEESSSQAEQTASPAENSETPPSENAEPPAPQPVPAAGILFIGDSRCVQMQEAVGGGGCSWVCENAKGYDWLKDTAIPRADGAIGKGTKVVICLGVNDTRNCNNYAAIVNQKAAEWAARGAKTYYVSVNPVWENPYTSEEQVENFNASIIGQLNGIKWIDTHSWLMANGYRLVDGLHYDANTYINIFNVIVGSL